MIKEVSILGVRLSCISRRVISELLGEWLRKDTFRQIVTVNPEFIVEAQKNEEFRRILNGAALQLIDGFGTYLAARSRARGAPCERITGVEATRILSELASMHGRRVYLVGGGPGVAQKAAEKLLALYPGLLIAGAEEGVPEMVSEDVRQDAGAGLAERIRAAAPDILLVAFGAPKQELWIERNRYAFPSVKIAMGVGGTFDYLAGTASYAPAWLRKSGLEWLYRLIRQPRRARRIWNAVVVFSFLFIRSEVFNRKKAQN